MKKIILGIVATMMVFGTMTVSADNVAQDRRHYHDNDYVYGRHHDRHPKYKHNKHKKHRKDYHMDRRHHDSRFYNDRNCYNGRRTGHMGRRYIDVRHCMLGYRVSAPFHRHVYYYETVRGYPTGHLICTHCGRHAR